MSEKATCPGCDGYSSSILRGFEEEGACPFCGLSAEVAAAVDAARERKADSDLADRVLAAEKRAMKAEREALALRRVVVSIRGHLRTCLCGAELGPFSDPVLPHDPVCPRAERTTP